MHHSLVVDYVERFPGWAKNAGTTVDAPVWGRGGGFSYINIHTPEYQRLPKQCQLFLTEDDYWARAYARNYAKRKREIATHLAETVFIESDSGTGSNHGFAGYTPPGSPV